MAELTAAKPSDRGKIVDKYQKMTGKSPKTIYRMANEYGWSSGKKQRSDTGDSVLTRNQVLEAAKMLKRTQRNGKSMIMPGTVALTTLSDSPGDFPDVSASTLNRHLRLNKISKADMSAPSPHVTMRSLYSNHVHQFDTSNCVQYFFADDNGGMGERDMTLFYKNKVKNFKKIRRELLRYIMVDHKSGAFFVDYFYAEGENTKDQLDFFHRAWSQKDEPHKFPFCGVPDMLITDQGSALTSAVSKNLLNRLEVKLTPHKVKNSRAKGSVERLMWLWETHFESLLREQPAPNLETLRAWAYDKALWLNATMVHRRYGTNRFSMWLKCVEKALRLPPEYEIFQELALSDPEDRQVSGSLSIRWDGLEYSVRHIPQIRRKDKVDVFISPYHQAALVVEFDKKRYLAHEIKKDISGQPMDAPVWGVNYKSHKDTITQKTLKEADEVETGPYKVFGHHAAKVEAVHYLPKTGTPIEIKREIAEVSILTMIRQAKDILGRSITKEENQMVRQKFGTLIPENKISEIINLLQTESGKYVSTKRAVGSKH